MSWLENLKPGDKVIVRKCDRYYQIDEIKIIKTIGKTLISLEGWDGQTRFRVSDGYSVHGGTFDSYKLFPATEEHINKIEQQKQKLGLVRKIEKCDFSKLPLEALKQILEVVENN